MRKRLCDGLGAVDCDEIGGGDRADRLLGIGGKREDVLALHAIQPGQQVRSGQRVETIEQIRPIIGGHPLDQIEDGLPGQQGDQFILLGEGQMGEQVGPLLRIEQQQQR